MGAALPIVAIGMQVAGTVADGIGANSEARAAARVDDENARLSILAGERDVEQVLRDERMIAGDALARMGGSGVMIGGGSVATLLMDSERQAARDVATRRDQARSERDNYLQAAKDKRRAGKQALIGSLFSGVGQALGGAASLKQQGRRTQQREKERRSGRGD